MEKNKKDKELENAFREYFDGVDKPQCDLSQAKQALAGDQSRRSRRRALAGILSACACFLCALIVGIVLLPSYFRGIISDNDSNSADSEVQPPSLATVYSLRNVSESAVSGFEIRSRYGDEVGAFRSFELADNASCEYALCEWQGETVLARATLSYVGEINFSATVYIDVTEGKYAAEELFGYNELPSSYGGGRYETETDKETGSYYSRLYYSHQTEYFAQILSDDPDAAEYFLQYLRKNV